MFLGLPTFYNTGTASITTGTKLITFQGAALGSLDFPAVLPGDLFMDPAQPEFPPQRIESIDYSADPQTATLAFNWPGASMTTLPYEIRLVGNIERSTAQTRRYLELLGQIGYTGIAVNAFGEFSDRTLYDDMVQGYTFLSFDGDGTVDSPPYIYIKKSSASADWSDPIPFVGGEGPPGPTGQAAVWLSGTGVPAGGLGNNGDMYIDVATADVYGPKTAGAWGAVAINIKGEQGDPGVDGIDGTSMLSRIRVVSDVNVDIATLNDGDTIDGLVVATNWLVLLAGQTDATENGVYVIGATAGTTARAAAFDTFDELPGTYFSVMQGTTYGDTLWKCESDLGGTIGVDDLSFVQFASSEGFMDRTYLAYALNSGTVYALPTEPSSANSLDVYVGGILQPKDGVAYTYLGTTLTLSEDPGATDLVEVYIFQALPVGSVPDGSVGADQINAAQAAAILAVLGAPDLTDVREKLTANRTYYVRTDGSDSNTGLANTSGGAFLTIAKALTVAATLDCSIYNVTVQVGAGTWTVPVILPQMIGSGTFTLTGDPGTPANVVISTTSAEAIRANAINSVWFVDGFKLQTTTSGSGIWAQSGATIFYKNIDFSACATAHVRADNRARAMAYGATTISGNALIHWFLDSGGYIFDAGFTITLTGTPAFSNAFLQAAAGGVAKINNNTFVGSATGKRFTLTNGAVANVNGAGLNYIPGSIAGTADQTSAYDSLNGAREVLLANRTYFVRPDGSDSNDGLSNTSGGAFLTVQKAINVVAALDRSVFDVTISIQAGTFAAGQNTINGWGPGSNAVIVSGVGATTIINTTSNCFYIKNAVVAFSNMKLTSSTLSAFRIEAGGNITHSGIEFGACTQPQIWIEQFARAICTGNFTISGSAPSHVFARYSGASYECYSKTITITGTPAFSSSFVAATMHGNIIHGACTFSGAATGKRFAVDTGGIIDSGGGGANYFPGNVAGTGTNFGTSPYGAYV